VSVPPATFLLPTRGGNLALLLGLDAAEWTAIGTVAVAATALVSIMLTFVLARQAKRSAQAAAAAAEAARKTAEAAQRSSAVDAATLPIDFKVTAIFWGQVGGTEERPAGTLNLIRVETIASRLWVHGAVVTDSWGELEGEAFKRRSSLRVPCTPTDTLPTLLHKGEATLFDWPLAQPKQSDEQTWLKFEIEYSVDRDGDRESIGQHAEIMFS
jgi:hypothetical protein